MTDLNLKHIVEAVLLAAGQPLSLDQILTVFGEAEPPQRDEIRAAIAALQEDYAQRGIELVEVASGFRIQVKQDMEAWVSRLTEEKPARYSRALLETLALVAYRQPITRGEIENIRGVSVSSSIMKTLQDREWVRVVGHRDVPGRPAMYGTTRQFLDYFNLKGLDDMPTLMELRDIDTINAELDLNMPGEDIAPDDSDEPPQTDGGENNEGGDAGVGPQLAVNSSEAAGTIH
jgi:segregation and condensation protein B